MFRIAEENAILNHCYVREKRERKDFFIGIKYNPVDTPIWTTAFYTKNKKSLSSSGANSTDSHSYHPSLLVSPLDGIQCPYRASQRKFMLVRQHWGVCIKERH